MTKRRLILAIAAPAIALLGLATRRFPGAFPALMATYGGDALWAALVFCLCAIVAPNAKTVYLAAVAFGISLTVELSQLLRWEWLDAIRATRLGALVLGRGFLWSDLASYAVGILLAAAVDVPVRRMRSPR